MGSTAKGPKNPKGTKVASTQVTVLGSQEQAQDMEIETQEGHQKRGPSGLTRAAPEKKQPQTKGTKQGPIDITKVPGLEKQKIVDFRDAGERGWLMAMLNGKSVQQAKSGIGKLGRTLRR